MTALVVGACVAFACAVSASQKPDEREICLRVEGAEAVDSINAATCAQGEVYMVVNRSRFVSFSADSLRTSDKVVAHSVPSWIDSFQEPHQRQAFGLNVTGGFLVLRVGDVALLCDARKADIHKLHIGAVVEPYDWFRVTDISAGDWGVAVLADTSTARGVHALTLGRWKDREFSDLGEVRVVPIDEETGRVNVALGRKGGSLLVLWVQRGEDHRVATQAGVDTVDLASLKQWNVGTVSLEGYELHVAHVMRVGSSVFSRGKGVYALLGNLLVAFSEPSPGAVELPGWSNWSVYVYDSEMDGLIGIHWTREGVKVNVAQFPGM